MATNEEIEQYCRNCVNRDFITGKGLVCKLTKEAPAFESTCENFQEDEELLKVAPPKPDDFPVTLSEEELLAEENLPKGVLFASVACVLCAIAWGLVSISTGYQSGIMAIGVGFIVGFAMKQGKGVRQIFGVIGALLALLSCVMGDFISIAGLISKSEGMPFLEVVKEYHNEIFSMIYKNVLSMTALFYGIAVYEGYKLSFRSRKQPKGGQI